MFPPPPHLDPVGWPQSLAVEGVGGANSDDRPGERLGRRYYGHGWGGGGSGTLTSQQSPDPHSVSVFCVVDPEPLVPDTSNDPTLKQDREFS